MAIRSRLKNRITKKVEFILRKVNPEVVKNKKGKPPDFPLYLLTKLN